MVEAAFLRNDLPYFTELLGEVITKTRYTSMWTFHMLDKRAATDGEI